MTQAVRRRQRQNRQGASEWVVCVSVLGQVGRERIARMNTETVCVSRLLYLLGRWWQSPSGVSLDSALTWITVPSGAFGPNTATLRLPADRQASSSNKQERERGEGLSCQSGTEGVPTLG